MEKELVKLTGFVAGMNIKENPKTEGRWIAEFNLGDKNFDDNTVTWYNNISMFLVSEKQKAFIEREVQNGAVVSLKDVQVIRDTYEKDGETRESVQYIVPTNGVFVITSTSEQARRKAERDAQREPQEA